ncbi:MAG TPA: septum formation initiator family protein [Stackebrandtia sp.]|uniref:FtsB family cell division protein n=1 Tax=Stackebrandtia sp. TaxID=2023065 RepID=UPI002D4C3832|nr:septum formation initiator family protein [Stackebrandtia sp.]HZE38903.1 septum formation initiator family protein [Stackebrandtia sp.]
MTTPRKGPGGQRPGSGQRSRKGRQRPQQTAGRAPATPTTKAAKPRPILRRIRVKPPWRMSGRTAVVALVLSVLALTYAYPVRTYIEQRSEINALLESQGAQADRIKELKAERAKWNDPDYVRAQARQRLLMVRPGEELIIMVNSPDSDSRGGGKHHKKSGKPWYSDLWDSFHEADQIGHK